MLYAAGHPEHGHPGRPARTRAADGLGATTSRAQAIRIGGGPGSYRPRALRARRTPVRRDQGASTARSPRELQAEVGRGASGSPGTRLDATRRADRRDRRLLARSGLQRCSAGGSLRSHPTAACPRSRTSWTGWPPGERDARAPSRRTGGDPAARGGAQRAGRGERPRPRGRAPRAAAADGGRPGQVGVRLERLPRAAHPADEHLGLPRAARREPRATRSTRTRPRCSAIAQRNVARLRAADRGPAGPQPRRAARPSTSSRSTSSR